MGKRLEKLLISLGMVGVMAGGAYSTVSSVNVRDTTSIEERVVWEKEYKTGWLVTTSSLIPFALGAGIKIGRYQNSQESRSEGNRYERN